MTRKPLVVSVTVAAIVALLLALLALREGSVGAQPIPGATYTGTLSGGGSLEFRVSADGTWIKDLSITGPGGCHPLAGSQTFGAAIPIVNNAFAFESNMTFGRTGPSCTFQCQGPLFDGSFPSPGNAEGTIGYHKTEQCDFDLWTWTATTSATPVPSPTAIPTPTPTPGQMHNCPQAGKWAIAVWDGDDGTDAEQALTTCGEGAVAAAYSIDRETQVWSRWFAGRAEISNLTTISSMQGVVALGGAGASVSASATSSAEGDAMQNCPLQGKWAISVWSGEDDTDAEQALTTCGEGAVAAAYSIDRETEVWSRWFAGRAEISNLTTLKETQGVLVLGGAGVPATPAGVGVPMFRGDPAHTGMNPGPGVEQSPEQLWRFETGGWVTSSPAVVDGVVYIGSQDSYLYALEAATGQERWRFGTGARVGSSPAVVDGVVYVGSWDNYVYALEAATGQERWRFETDDEVQSSPVVVDGVVYIGSADSYVYALDVATGQERWRFETDGAVFSSPAVADGVVYVGSYDNRMYALNAATGEQLWRSPTGYGLLFSSAAVVDGVVYFGSYDNYVYALDAATGEEFWRFETGGEVSSSPAVVDGVVYVGSQDSYVYALDAATGEQLWRFQTRGIVWSSPAVVDGVVYIGSRDSSVYALDAATGEELWRFRTGSWVSSSPAVVDGVVYIGSNDDHAYAITEE